MSAASTWQFDGHGSDPLNFAENLKVLGKLPGSKHMALSTVQYSPYVALSTRVKCLYMPSCNGNPSACRICPEWVDLMKPSLLQQGFAERDLERCRTGVDPWIAIRILDGWTCCPDPFYRQQKRLLRDQIVFDLREQAILRNNINVAYNFWTAYPCVHSGPIWARGHILDNWFSFAADGTWFLARLSQWTPAPQNSLLMWQCLLQIDDITFRAKFRYENLGQERILFCLQDCDDVWPPAYPMAYYETTQIFEIDLIRSHAFSIASNLFGSQPSSTGSQGF